MLHLSNNQLSLRIVYISKKTFIKPLYYMFNLIFFSLIKYQSDMPYMRRLESKVTYSRNHFFQKTTKT